MSKIEIPMWFISFCTALLAAFFGSFLAIRKFKKEKIWNEKYQAYQDILASLEAMLLWENETYCYQKMIPTKGTQSIEGDNWPSFAEARRIIAKTTCVGSLLLPSKVIDELESLERDLWDENFRADDESYYYPNTDEESEAIAQHAKNVEKLIKPKIEAIIKHAQKDIGKL